MAKNFILSILAIGLVIISVLLVISKNPIQEKNILSVSGQAKVITGPDKADIYVRIYTESLTATEAKDKNAEITDGVTKALSKYVKSEDIETSQYRLNLKQKWDKDKGEYITVGYEVVHVLKIITKNIKETGLLVDVAVNNGANNIDGVEFGLTNEKQKKINAEALEKALLEAKSKAESISKVMNVKLIGIHRISESNYYFTPFRYEAAEIAKAGTQISPGNIEVSASITVEYLI